MSIEETVIQYLASKNLSAGAHVYAETPVKPPELYIIVEKTGSGSANLIDRAQIAVQSIGDHTKKTLLDVIRLNEEIKEAMAKIIYEVPNIYRCKINSDYNFTNPETKEYRYQAVFDIHY